MFLAQKLLAGNTIAAGPVTQFTADTVAKAAVCKVDTDKVIIAWGVSATSIKAVVGTVDGRTITFGSPITMQATTLPSNQDLSIEPVSTNRAVVGWETTTATFVEGLTATGTTLSRWSWTNPWTNGRPPSMAQLDTDKYLVGVIDPPGNAVDIRVLTTISDAHDDGPLVSPTTAPLECRETQACGLDTDKALVIFVDSTGDDLIGVVATASGTVVTLGSDATLIDRTGITAGGFRCAQIGTRPLCRCMTARRTAIPPSSRRPAPRHRQGPFTAVLAVPSMRWSRWMPAPPYGSGR